ncbi:unnamed protein product [Prunus armeniaca]|uniref:Uncharacterized protein n=1 Tax=Prunus armeniaca TaxID=36596 RepID=A0A6J5UCD8_PRUAR|nr:unnamed protein product [Prunus armeniaca]CAB4304520.1 unnamed protein product [Prunus armeniaca]
MRLGHFAAPRMKKTTFAFAHVLPPENGGEKTRREKWRPLIGSAPTVSFCIEARIFGLRRPDMDPWVRVRLLTNEGVTRVAV